MPTVAWVIYDLIVAVLGYFALDRPLSRREKGILGVIIVAGLGVAIYSGYSDYADHAESDALHTQVNELQRAQAYNTGQLNTIGQVSAETLDLLATKAGTSTKVGPDAVASAAASKISDLQKQVATQENEIADLKAQFKPWRLSPKQQAEFDKELTGWTVPATFKGVYSLIASDESQAHAAEFLNVLNHHGYPSHNYTMGLPAGIRGVYVAVDVSRMEDVPPDAITLGKALEAAHIKFKYISDLGKQTGLEKPQDFALAVGGPDVGQ